MTVRPSTKLRVVGKAGAGTAVGDFDSCVLRGADLAFTNGARLVVPVSGLEQDRLLGWSQGGPNDDQFTIVDGLDGFTYVLNLRHLALAQFPYDYSTSNEEKHDIGALAASSRRVRLFTVGRIDAIDIAIREDEGDAEEGDYGPLYDFVYFAEHSGDIDPVFMLRDASGDAVVLRSHALVAAVFPTHLRGCPDDSSEDPEDSADKR